MAKQKSKRPKAGRPALKFSVVALFMPFVMQTLLAPAVTAQQGEPSPRPSLKAETPVSSPGLKEETPESASPSSLKEETPAAAPAEHTPSRANTSELHEERAKPAARPTTQVATPKTTMLFGRIEQIAGRTGASFPELKAMTPKLDMRGTTTQLKAKATATQLSGTVVNSFPQDYSGNYGGTLAIWRFEQDPIAYQVNPEEAKWTAAMLKQGLTGNVNFDFARASNGKMSLEPAKIAFMVPLKDTYASTQMNQMFSGAQGGQMNGLMQSMMGSMAGSMNVPVQMYLGNVQTTGMETGVSGMQFRSTLLKNEIRELAGNVIEQQLVTYQVSQMKTGGVEKSYGETVLRFTRQSADQMYVQVAIVNFTESRHFRDKTVMYGTVRKGQVVQTTQPDPMAGMGDLSKMMGLPAGSGSGSGAGAAGGAGQLEEQIRKMLNP